MIAAGVRGYWGNEISGVGSSVLHPAQTAVRIGAVSTAKHVSAGLELREKLTTAFPNPVCFGGRFPSTSEVLGTAFVDILSENEQSA